MTSSVASRPGFLRWLVTAGDPATLVATFSTAAGSPVNLSGSTVAAACANWSTSHAGSATVGGASNNEVTVAFTDTITGQLTGGGWTWTLTVDGVTTLAGPLDVAQPGVAGVTGGDASAVVVVDDVNVAVTVTTTGGGGAVDSVNGETGVVVLDAADVGAVDVALVGAPDGVAELDSGGLVPSSQLPSYVDDVIEAANFAALPGTGATGKIYVTLDNNLTYRWSGSAYVEISASLALGETSSTAYRGDRGKTAYDHSQVVAGNPHGTTAADVGADPSGTAATAVTAHDGSGAAHADIRALIPAVLARTSYLPSGLSTFVATGSPAVLSAGNLAATFTAPESGTVEVELDAMAVGGYNRLSWGVREGSVDLTDQALMNAVVGPIRERVSLLVTGLTPGPHTLTWTQFGTGSTYAGTSGGNWNANMTVTQLPVEGVSAEHRRGAISGQNYRLIVPPGPGPRPLIMYCHGRGGNEMSLESLSYVSYIMLAHLLNAGWMVATSNGSGDAFGNADVCNDFAALHNWVNAIYPVSDVVMWGESMGGLAAMNLAGGTGSIPNMRGAMIFAALTDLAGAYAGSGDPSFTGQINTAFGITGTTPNTYAEKTVGLDPMLRPDANYAGKRFLISTTTDSTAPSATHGAPLIAKLTGVAAEVMAPTFTGGHSSPNRYDDPAAILAFLDRCVS